MVDRARRPRPASTTAARFDAHLALGGGLDPTWLDLFAEAARDVTGGDEPGRFHRCAARARRARATPSERTIERVDPTWITRGGADPRPRRSTRSPGAGSSSSRTSSGGLPREEKPWIRDLAGRLVAFCRAADRAPDVLFAWSLAVTDATPDRRGVVRGQSSRSGTPGRPSTPRATSTTSTGFKAGGVRLRPYEIEMVGDVDGQVAAPPAVPLRDRHPVVGAARGAGHRRRLVARRGRAGARRSRTSSGSPRRASSSRTCTTCRRTSTAPFDIVYTSRGVLGWLPDIRGWAQVVAHFLAPGGTFFITEIHPVIHAFENEGVEPGELRLRYPYWEHAQPLVFEVKGSYADRGRRRRRPGRARLGSRARRDRDGADRRRPADRDARRAPVPRLERRLPRRGRRTGKWRLPPDDRRASCR